MPEYTNTRTLLGDDGALDALIAHTLTEYNDDQISTIGNNAFYYQENLESVYLPNTSAIGSNAFANCANLKRLFVGLNRSSVTTLSSSNALTNTGRSIIYVPDSLVTNYRSASQWSTYAGRIYGISDLGLYEWDETEIQDSEADLLTYIANGTAASRYNIGQYKTIDLGTEGQIRFQIVGKHMRELANSTDTADLEWLAMDALKTTHRMNPAFDNSTEGTGTIGGYDKSEMKTYIDNDIWALVPSGWQNVIKETKIVSTIYNTSGSKVNNEVTTSKLRIPSYREVIGNTSNESSGPMYSMAFPDDNSRIRKTAGTTSAANWWLRSAYSTTNFRNVSYNGSDSNNNARNAYSVVLGFST